ncbi:MAG: hypothetical protein H6807_08380 [Planctomycetes bacterium]|nr:hypothetical protein [Planctomycetota bacterium]
MVATWLRRLLVVVAGLTLGGCLIDVHGPLPEPAAPGGADEAELESLLREADARIAAAPVGPRVGDSPADHDAASCQDPSHHHDHDDNDDHDHEDDRGGEGGR